MSRKVLGDDPFAATPSAKSAKPVKKPAQAPAAKLKKPAKKPAKKPLDAGPTVEAAPAVDSPTPIEAPPPAPPEVVAEPPPPSDAPSRLDEILGALDGDASLRAQVLEALGATATNEPTAPEAAEPEALAATTGSTDDGAMMASEFYRQHWGRIAMRDRSETTDDFGLDPAYEARWRPVWEFLYDRWWRVEVEGIHHIPAEGPAALVANHGGAVPFDGVMLSTAVRREHPAQRQLRWLAEDFVFHMPFAGAFVNRIGAVRACQENAERLIRQGNLVALFPEGVKGIGKLYKDRYKLQRFGRGGHIKLAIRTRSPIIPVTILGNEDTHPMLAGSDRLAKLLGMPYLPITPTFPLLGPLGLLPLPAKWRIIFGEPIPVAHLPPEAADDELLVGRLNEKLRATIQDTLDRALRERVSVFKG